MKCPRCGNNNMNPVKEMNALSRYVDIYICSDCGTDEALRDFFGEGSLPYSEWFCNRKEK